LGFGSLEGGILENERRLTFLRLNQKFIFVLFVLSWEAIPFNPYGVNALHDAKPQVSPGAIQIQPYGIEKRRFELEKNPIRLSTSTSGSIPRLKAFVQLKRTICTADEWNQRINFEGKLNHKELKNFLID
jgi:hypothetical protein